MKCSDIKDEVILELLYPHQGRWMMLWGNNTLSVWVDDEPIELTPFPPEFPHKLLMAKFAKLYKRGLIAGCPCGCRGDFEITDKGLEVLGKPRIRPFTGY